MVVPMIKSRLPPFCCLVLDRSCFSGTCRWQPSVWPSP
jgi:hypothetical protein